MFLVFGRRGTPRHRPIWAVLAVGATAAFVCNQTAAAPDSKPKAAAKPPANPGSAPTVKAITGPMRLSYLYKPGDVRRYSITAFFTGHIPQFSSTAEGEPTRLMASLDYASTVKKVSDKGAEVEFNVERAEINILEKDADENGKFDPKDAAELPIALSQVQKTLNATVTFKPNGAIAGITGGDSSAVKIDIGFDLRKLFLVTAPVIFSDKPVRPADQWPFDDGLLGSKPGKTSYTGKLVSLGGTGKSVKATILEQGDSSVDSKLDKDGNSTENAAAVVGSLVGKVSLTGAMQFAGTTDAPGAAGGAAGRVTDGRLSMTVLLKRTLPDPDQPDKKQVSDIDVKARMFIKPQTTAPKASSPSQPPTSPPSSGPSADKSGKKTK